jgi:heat shock protein HslJ
MIIVGLLFVVLAACTGGGQPEATEAPVVEETAVEPTTAPAEPTAETAADPLAGTAWQLASMANSSLVPDSTITAEFADGTMSGSAGCNNYFTSYTVDGSNITLGPAGSTMMFCEPQALMDQEAAYLAALGSVRQFQMANGQLVLLDEGGNAVLTYNAAEAEAETQMGLSDATWLLSTMNVGGDATVSVIEGTRLTAVFNPDGTVTGNGGCNTFNGSYTTDGNNITIGTLASTTMACAEDVMGQETAYLAALQSANTYQIFDDILELYAADGNWLLAFNAEPPQTLAGSSWVVTSYNNGNQAVVGVIEGTEMTAVFGEDGTLSGSGGCNTYTTTYEATENTITIGPAASTMMFCESPEGVMDQEAQYLAALATAATYQIDGDTLAMRTADDAMAVNFQRSQ